MILTDGIHLVSDISLKELHAFAARIQLHRAYFHRDHYDILWDDVALRIAACGIEVVSAREIVRRKCSR